jgi:hypothetical protein
MTTAMKTSGRKEGKKYLWQNTLVKHVCHHLKRFLFARFTQWRNH